MTIRQPDMHPDMADCPMLRRVFVEHSAWDILWEHAVEEGVSARWQDAQPPLQRDIARHLAGRGLYYTTEEALRALMRHVRREHPDDPCCTTKAWARMELQMENR